MVDDTGHIEGRLHREVITAATADLLVVAHDAQFCLPEFQSVFGDGVAQLFPYLPHVGDGGVCPITVSHHQPGHIGHLAEVGGRTVFREEGAYLVSALPVGLVGVEQTAQVARLIDDDLGRQSLSLEFLAGLPHEPGYLTVGGGRPLLFWPEPVPVPVGFVDRTDVVKMDAVMLKGLNQQQQDALFALLDHIYQNLREEESNVKNTVK